jgi:hypothetical protein
VRSGIIAGETTKFDTTLLKVFRHEGGLAEFCSAYWSEVAWVHKDNSADQNKWMGCQLHESDVTWIDSRGKLGKVDLTYPQESPRYS